MKMQFNVSVLGGLGVRDFIDWYVLKPNHTCGSIYQNDCHVARMPPSHGLDRADGYDFDGTNLIVKNPDYSHAAQYFLAVQFFSGNILQFYAEATVLGKV